MDAGGADQRVLQPLHVRAGPHAQLPQAHYGVHHQLPRAMVGNLVQ